LTKGVILPIHTEVVDRSAVSLLASHTAGDAAQRANDRINPIN
jgi:hypothetical protein